MMIDKTEKKEIQPLETEVKEFVCSQPYWAKYICSQILSGSEISDKIIEQAFSYLLEELKLKKETKKPEIPIVYNKITSGDFKEDVIFNSIMNVEGVNALSEKQTIELTPNLTIVYGANGSGKSGYVRLLKNVFYSKDKTPILPNIYNSLVRKPISAIFNFSCNGDTISLKYPENEGNGIFSQFAVFDGDIGKKHLSTRNNFSFRPAGLKLFNAFNMSLEKLSARLNREIQMKNIANPFTDNDIFQGDSIIKTFLIKLSKNSNLNELTNLLPFTESEKLEKIEAEKEFDDLKIKLAQKEKTLKELNRIKEQLKRKKINLEKINLLFSQNQLDLINISIIDCKTKTQNAKIEGVEKFQTEKIKNVGSDEWKNFILAAEKFSSIQNCLEYPVIGDNCLFCHQPINEDVTKNLIRSYWDYTKSISENEAKTAKEKNEKIKNTYLELDLKQFPVSDTLTVWLKEKYEKELLNLQEILDQQIIIKQAMIKNIDSLNNVTNTEVKLDLNIIDSIIKDVDKEIETFEQNEQNKILTKLLERKTYLKHKEKLEVRFLDIKKLYENMIWVDKANNFNKQSFKSHSTITEKRLSTKYFNIDYIKAFNEECEKLNGSFGIEIDAKSSDAKSNRQLFLKGKDPSVILSEGEQKVIELADFIAEANITTINKGLVFDDPVNSMDEKRKTNIAERLVSISENKQVLIFTHDLVFVSSLLKSATDMGLQNECHWIENREGKPGLIWLRNSPSYEEEYRNVKPVIKYYEDLNKSDCSPEKKESLLKNGFTALRTCYEVLVIHELLCNVVQRFDERVSIESLKSVEITEDVKNKLLEGFHQCCKYMEGHSHSDKYAYKKPEPKNLYEEILRYNTIKKTIKDLKKSKIGK